jgi:hypothetical protein
MPLAIGVDVTWHSSTFGPDDGGFLGITAEFSTPDPRHGPDFADYHVNFFLDRLAPGTTVAGVVWPVLCGAIRALEGLPLV